MLYLKYFGLREPPFGITPDTSFFYANRSMQEALNTLLIAVNVLAGLVGLLYVVLAFARLV